MNTTPNLIVPANLALLDELVLLEERCFETDRLSRRSFRRFISGEQCVFLVAQREQKPVGYLIILFHRGTRLARLYSIGVNPEDRRQGLATALLAAGETEARQRGAIHLRLEVSPVNHPAIQFYGASGYREFGVLDDYYDDHSPALRMQKRIRYLDQRFVHADIPWFPQYTPFTCGPVALMMAMKAFEPKRPCDLKEELRLWRETTTIYMTSGHGGCHPFGLALAARRRGFGVEVWISKRGPLFVEGVRSEEKKKVIQTAHADFLQQANEAEIPIHYKAIDQQKLRQACDRGAIPIVLISTFRFDRKKAPHWVVVSGYDERCFYVHDPDFDQESQVPVDLQHVPIAVEDYGSIAAFGSRRLRIAVILSRA